MALPVFTVGGAAHAVDFNFLLAPPRAILRQTSPSSFVTATDTVVNLDTQDEASDCTTTTGAAHRITITTAGLYEVSFDMSFVTNATGNRQARVTKNGLSPATAANQLLSVTGAPAGTDVVMSAAALIRFAAADYIQLWGFQNSGSTINTTVLGGAPKLSVIFRSA